jgi:3-isopropylmalate/(R)-2-methylmalate dehydratase small subunit
MQTFTVHRGVAAPLMRVNIDTDAIIPSREMKLVSKEGLGEGLFAGWRYLQAGSRQPNPGFVLNQLAYSGTSILLAGSNFGCGSSREHAVWALKEYGIRAIVAESFGTIFYHNCTRNGLLPVVLPHDVVEELARQVALDPQGRQLSIDLAAQVVSAPDGQQHHFEIAATPKTMLLEGLDPIALTLKFEQQISQYAAQHLQRMPWLA